MPQSQAEPAPAPVVVQQPTPFSFRLKDAPQYTGYAESALRAAIKDGRLRATSKRPYIILRADLEAFVVSEITDRPTTLRIGTLLRGSYRHS